MRTLRGGRRHLLGGEVDSAAIVEAIRASPDKRGSTR
jgi:hypothetical protein